MEPLAKQARPVKEALKEKPVLLVLMAPLVQLVLLAHADLAAKPVTLETRELLVELAERVKPASRVILGQLALKV